MSIQSMKAKAFNCSSPFYLYSLYSTSLFYYNLPFPANSDQEAVMRIRHSVNSPDFDTSGVDDLSLVRVGSFSSSDKRPLLSCDPVTIVADIRTLINKEVVDNAQLSDPV